MPLLVCTMSDLVTSDHADDDDDADDTGIDIVKIMPCASEILHLTMTIFLYCKLLKPLQKLTNLPLTVL